MCPSTAYADSKLQVLATAYFAELKAAKTTEEVETLRVKYLGRQGAIASLMANLSALSLEEKRARGPEYNRFKTEAQAALDEKLRAFSETQDAQRRLKQQNFDVTAYLPRTAQGSLHPHSRMTEEVENVLISMGFEILDGPEVERDEINFEALNIPKHHPARDMQDTFWLTLPDMLLRTHTSSVQVHGMRSQPLPLACAALGRCYRHEATDASHDFVFSQCEGFLIDKKISMAHLFATIRTLLKSLFHDEKLDIRVRPSYFPFVEPGVEIDMSCPFCKTGCSTCKQSRWVEICGAGLIHPNVLRASNIDPQIYSGFAFGFGLTRLVMLKYGIGDIRLLHNGKVEFLKQF